ncbi:uncharacterized protein [Primulina eburnea]|uniref:uncharacterized protein n=1 Tax=Primulina eburnea TaxID=1245227 RepID=UPI003C6C942F
MFCRLSIKDIKVNNHRKDQTSVEEPASPKVSCIGQVKRNSRVLGHPALSANHHKSTNPRKLFSSKTILPTTTNIGAKSGIRSCRTNAETAIIKLKTNGRGEGCVKVVDIGDLDPPLPVVHRAAPPLGVGQDEINIWKRRCNGVALKHLQVQQIHLLNYNFPPRPPV